jgi:hypothetical protein
MANYGTTLLKNYNYSLYDILSTAYKDKTWYPWQFRAQSDPKTFLDWAAQQLDLKDLTGWYNVTQKDLIANGGKQILKQYNNSMYELLTAAYPEFPWEQFQFRAAEWDLSGNSKHATLLIVKIIK